MNLSAYDKITEKIDKSKSWIHIKTKKLITREIKYRPYSTILKRYVPSCNIYEYYLVISDTTNNECKFNKVLLDDYNRLKISLLSIWKETSLSKLTRNVNVNITLDDKQDDCEIYKLDI